MVVDLPAPFGPTKPVTWPGWTAKDMPSRASVGPNRLRSPATSIVASMVTEARDRRRPRSSRLRAVFGLVARSSPLRGTARYPARGTRPVRPAGTMRDDDFMATGRTRRRIAGSPSALALAGALLALAAFGQAIAQGLSHTGERDRRRRLRPVHGRRSCLLALAAHGPADLPAPGRGGGGDHRGERAGARRRSAQPTVAGLIAQVIASYRLGWTAGFGRAAPAGDAAGPAGPRRRPRRAAASW